MIMLIATIAACASTATRESTGEYVDDSVITTKVKSLLAADDFLKSFKISVGTRMGVVQLSGFVGTQDAVKSILNAVVVIAVVLWLLNVFGILGSFSKITVGK
jgi:osmotically-inducible protein OsmY